MSFRGDIEADDALEAFVAKDMTQNVDAITLERRYVERCTSCLGTQK